MAEPTLTNRQETPMQKLYTRWQLWAALAVLAVVLFGTWD
jgi:hypothetical protein